MKDSTSLARQRSRLRLSRRHWFQALAGASCLPFLEVLSDAPAHAQAESFVPRLLVYYLPNGRVPEWWEPTMTAGQLVFPTQAAALNGFSDRALALTALSNNAALNSPGAAHAMGTATILTSRAISALSGPLKNGISVDQAVANVHGKETRFQSIQWSAGEPGPCDVGGSPCAYTQSVSWAGEGMPLSPTIDPRVAFEQLFSASTDGLSGERARIRKTSLGSVLDFVSGEGQALKRDLSAGDQLRLEEYFESVRQLETRVTAATSECQTGEPPTLGLPYEDRVEAFHDLITLALSCGQTNVLSFMIEFGLSGRTHPFLEATSGHHHLSHDMSVEGRSQLERVETWQAQKIASLLTRLDGAPGPRGGTLLDETLVLVMPSMGFGNTHNHARVAPILFGGGARFACDGRQADYGGAPLADFHRTLLEGFDVPLVPQASGALFGDDGANVLSGILTG